MDQPGLAPDLIDPTRARNDSTPTPILAEGTRPVSLSIDASVDPATSDRWPAILFDEASAPLAEGTQPFAEVSLPIVAHPPVAEIVVDAVAPVTVQPRHVWPWVAAAGFAIGTAIGGYIIYSERQAKQELDARFPVAASASERDILERDATRWSAGKRRLLATLAAFDPPGLESVRGSGACTLSIPAGGAPLADRDARPSYTDRDLDVTLRHYILPTETGDDLATTARSEIDHLIAAAERGRFQTTEGRDHIVRSLGSAFVVIRVDEHRDPELDRAHDGFAPGLLAGTAYAFDPTTGELRCAGAFRATSSGTLRTLSTFSGLDAAQEAISNEFSVEVETAIARALRAVD